MRFIDMAESSPKVASGSTGLGNWEVHIVKNLSHLDIKAVNDIDTESNIGLTSCQH